MIIFPSRVAVEPYDVCALRVRSRACGITQFVSHDDPRLSQRRVADKGGEGMRNVTRKMAGGAIAMLLVSTMTMGCAKKDSSEAMTAAQRAEAAAQRAESAAARADSAAGRCEDAARRSEAAAQKTEAIFMKHMRK